MRRRLVALSLAALVIVIAVPLGAAFTLERPAVGMPDVVLLQAAAGPAGALMTPWPEAGTLVLIGGLLLGLGSVVRGRS